MLCGPWLKALVGQGAVRALPLPVSATALQPVRALPSLVKAILPVGLVPVTVAVKVTAVPTVDGFNELAKVVVDGGGPAAALPQASTSTRREYCSSALLTLTRIRVVVTGGKVTARLTRVLPLTLLKVTQAVPFQPWTVKSVTPNWLKVRLSVGSIGFG